MIEALSEIISLTGVSGRMEPDRAEALVAPAITDDELSVFGVGITLSVLGAFLVRGEDTVAVVGVGKAGNEESLSEGWAPRGLIWETLVAAAMLRIPGTGFFVLARELGLEVAPAGGSWIAFSSGLYPPFSGDFFPTAGTALAEDDLDFAARVLGCGDPMGRGASSAGKSWSPRTFLDFDFEA